MGFEAGLPEFTRSNVLLRGPSRTGGLLWFHVGRVAYGRCDFDDARRYGNRVNRAIDSKREDRESYS